MHLGSRVDFAQLIKSYASSQTSYAERFNLSMRMHVRRLTRLTNAHSKTAQHHAAMIAQFIA